MNVFLFSRLSIIKIIILKQQIPVRHWSSWVLQPGDEIAAAADGLPDHVAETAKVRGRGLDLWETAGELLGELTNWSGQS